MIEGAVAYEMAMTNWQPMMSSSLRETAVSVDQSISLESCPVPRHLLLALEGSGHVGGLSGADS
jgi:hypothetical protein